MLKIILLEVVFQSVFYLEIYQNNIFYFFKLILNIILLKEFRNIKKSKFK
jgi:hypothetical protein